MCKPTINNILSFSKRDYCSFLELIKNWINLKGIQSVEALDYFEAILIKLNLPVSGDITNVTSTSLYYHNIKFSFNLSTKITLEYPSGMISTYSILINSENTESKNFEDKITITLVEKYLRNNDFEFTAKYEYTNYITLSIEISTKDIWVSILIPAFDINTPLNHIEEFETYLLNLKKVIRVDEILLKAKKFLNFEISTSNPYLLPNSFPHIEVEHNNEFEYLEVECLQDVITKSISRKEYPDCKNCINYTNEIDFSYVLEINQNTNTDNVKITQGNYIHFCITTQNKKVNILIKDNKFLEYFDIYTNKLLFENFLKHTDLSRNLYYKIFNFLGYSLKNISIKYCY